MSVRLSVRLAAFPPSDALTKLLEKLVTGRAQGWRCCLRGFCGFFSCDPFLGSFPRKPQTVSHKTPFPDSFCPKSTSGRLATTRLCRHSCASAAFGEVERRNSIAPYLTSSRKPILFILEAALGFRGWIFVVAARQRGRWRGAWQDFGVFFHHFRAAISYRRCDRA